MKPHDEEDYKEWLGWVDCILADCLAIDSSDLPDYPYIRWYNEGKDAAAVANLIIADCPY